MAELAAALKAEGRGLTDLLDDLAIAHGVHATDSFSVRVADLSQIDTVMRRLRADPPAEVAGVAVSRARRPGRRQRRRTAAHRRPALLPRGRLEGHRAPLRDRAEAQGLPRGHRAVWSRMTWLVRARAAERLAGVRSEFEAATAL